MAKVKVATIWLEGCSGCHMSFLDIDEAIIDLANVVEFTRTPITDIKEFPEVDVGIVEGSVGNTDEEEILRRGYIETESTHEGKIPGPPGVPALLDQVKPVNHVVKVDCFVPGCPPEPKAIF